MRFRTVIMILVLNDEIKLLYRQGPSLAMPDAARGSNALVDTFGLSATVVHLDAAPFPRSASSAGTRCPCGHHWWSESGPLRSYWIGISDPFRVRE